MSIYRMLSVCLLAACVVAAMGSPLTAGLIANGDFEAVTAGQFDSWNYSPANSGSVATASTTPTVIDGTYSAKQLHGSTDGGRFWQQVGDTPLSDFRWDLDFAVLPFSSAAGSRSMSILTFSSSDVFDSNDNADSIRVNVNNNIEFHRSGWHDTGLTVNTTPDSGTLLAFDGETPVINHLSFMGRGYGSPSQSFTLTLNGDTYSGYGTVRNQEIQYFSFAGDICAADFLVDNVSFHAVPEPCSLMLAAGALLGLLACTWRKRR